MLQVNVAIDKIDSFPESRPGTMKAYESDTAGNHDSFESKRQLKKFKEQVLWLS